MPENSFRRFRCWRTAQVQQTVFGDIGSLSTRDDAIFLAAHAPVPVERTKGVAAQVAGEAEILNALRSEIGVAGRNTLIAVTGDVGTGKSHAVRWVRAHLGDDPQRYRTIYVPRDLSTLRGLLGRILQGLPGEAARRAERQLDDAIGGKSDSQLRDELIDNLRQVLAFELPDEGPGDQDVDAREERSSLLGSRADRTERRREGLADILLNLTVREHLSRDDGTVAAVVHSIQAERGGRDESYPQFTREDIPQYSVGIRNRLDPGARVRVGYGANRPRACRGTAKRSTAAGDPHDTRLRYRHHPQRGLPRDQESCFAGRTPNWSCSSRTSRCSAWSTTISMTSSANSRPTITARCAWSSR